MLAGTRQAGPGRIHLHGLRILDIARHHRPAEEMDMLHLLDDPRSSMNIGKGRRAVAMCIEIENLRRSATCAKVNLGATKHKVTPAISSMKGDLGRQCREAAVHKLWRKQKAAIA